MKHFHLLPSNSHEAEPLFVYGTLRRGQPNHRELQRLDARFLGLAITVRSLRPATGPDGLPLLRTAAGGGAAGELYALNRSAAWARLDVFEGHPHFYQRRREQVRRPDGTELNAWVYFRTQ